jgi:hypothetical protein
MMVLSSKHGDETIVFNKRREFPDSQGIISFYMDLEFSTKFPGIATELLTPLLLISEVTG